MYAKSNPKISLEQHTNEVIENFKRYLTLYPDKFSKEEQDLIMKACLYHDYGKVNSLFQQYMNTGKKPLKWLQHGFFSPCFLSKKDLIEQYGEKGKQYYSALVTAIFYHHTRENLYFGTKQEQFEEDFKKYVKENGEQFLKREIPNEFSFSDLLFQYPDYAPRLIDMDTWILYSKIKGMLNRCDYAASALDDAIEENQLENGKALDDIIIAHYPKLKKAQEFSFNHQNENIVLIAPTGSGKTEAALLWIGKEKGFYTLPLKVASTAIYHRVKEQKYYGYSKVCLLHSDALDILIDEKKKEEPEETIPFIYQDYQRMKRLSYPLTICTVDQIFKFPFKSLGQEQFLATLSYSKVVIDEIQMYSSRILACLLVGLSMVVRAGGKFMIITATFPELFANLLKRVVGDSHYIIQNCVNDDVMLRHRIFFEENDFDYEKIIKSASDKKVLVICNSISKAIETYKRLKTLNEEVVKGLLHSHFIKKDRDLLETQILEFSGYGIWVTTPIVEASLDIDFDELYTEMCSADSLLQRFGRCYRKREYDKIEPNIFIYETGNAYIYDSDIYKRSIEKLVPYQGKLLSEQDKLEYLNEVYKESEIMKTKYYRDIVDDIGSVKNIYPMKYDYKEVQNLFREMTNVSIIPDEIFKQYDTEIQNVIAIIGNPKSNFEKRLLAKKELLQYTLSIRYSYKNKNLFTSITGTDLYRLSGPYSSELGFIEGEEKFEDRFS